MAQQVMRYTQIQKRSPKRHAMKATVYLNNSEPGHGEAGMVEGVQQPPTAVWSRIYIK